MNKQIIFTKINTAELLEAPTQPLGPRDVRVKTAYSTISCGTERANLTGNDSVSHVEPAKEAVFPRSGGYSSSGTVTECGSDVKNTKIGDRVAMFWSKHMTYNVISEDGIVKIGDSISFSDAAICHIACFPLAAVRKTKLEIGESMLIMGLGTLGLLAVKLARAAGAVPIVACDLVPERRAKALRFGADFVFDPLEPGFAEKVIAATGGGAKTAIEVTGIGAGLDETLDCMARFGRVALLGCTRSSDFTIDYYRKVHGPGITLIGAHTMARPKNESYSGYFTTRDDMIILLNLLESGRLTFETDETHAPEECGEVYTRLAFDKNFPPFVQFKWE